MPSLCEPGSYFSSDRPTDHRLLDRKLVDDIVYEVDCKMVTVKKGVDVDIGLFRSGNQMPPVP